MNQKILVFSGKKQAGKSTLASYGQGTILSKLGVIPKRFWVKNGELVSSFTDHTNQLIEMRGFEENTFVRQYSFAEPIKRTLIEIFGLSYEQCYGTDAQKNSLTRYEWENMPGLSETEFAGSAGPMTARQLMQYAGTNIFRKMYNDIWVEATLKAIKNDRCDLAIINDCRFPNEVLRMQKAGARVVRLTRDPFGDESHSSEYSLNRDRFDWNIFDAVIYNCSMTEPESYEAITLLLKRWGWV